MLPMAIIGGELGLFFGGLLYLLKGSARLSSTKTVHGPRVRLAGLACALPIPLTILWAAITRPPQEELLVASVRLLVGTEGIALAAIGLVMTMVLLYTTPTATP